MKSEDAEAFTFQFSDQAQGTAAKAKKKTSAGKKKKGGGKKKGGSQ